MLQHNGARRTACVSLHYNSTLTHFNFVCAFFIRLSSLSPTFSCVSCSLEKAFLMKCFAIHWTVTWINCINKIHNFIWVDLFIRKKWNFSRNNHFILREKEKLSFYSSAARPYGTQIAIKINVQFGSTSVVTLNFRWFLLNAIDCPVRVRVREKLRQREKWLKPQNRGERAINILLKTSFISFAFSFFVFAIVARNKHILKWIKGLVDLCALTVLSAHGWWSVLNEGNSMFHVDLLSTRWNYTYFGFFCVWARALRFHCPLVDICLCKSEMWLCGWSLNIDRCTQTQVIAEHETVHSMWLEQERQRERKRTKR